jgi:glycosyltransferase involved in cell wall biosynthesis
MQKFEKGLVSIIIPVFNRELLLPETLDSILEQTYSQWECIIVDDGSTDTSFEVALSYASKDSRFKVHQRPWYKRKGANSCRNYGFNISKGSFIQWFDSDDLMCFDFLQKKINLLYDFHFDLVVCKASFFYDNKTKIFHDQRKSIRPHTKNLAFEFFANDFWFGTPQAIIRKEFLNSFNLFNEKLTRNQETVLFVELLLKNPKIGYIDDSLILIRKHHASIGGNYLKKNNREKIEIDIVAFLMIHKMFLKSDFYNDNVKIHFKLYFYLALTKCHVFSKGFIFLFLYLFQKSFYFNRHILFKIFLKRIFN